MERTNQLMELLTTISANWDVIGLIISNIVALFVKPPLRKEK
jgi:hypothetical protein